MKPTGHLLGGMLEIQRKDRTGVPFNEREDAFLVERRDGIAKLGQILRRPDHEIFARQKLLQERLRALTARLTG